MSRIARTSDGSLVLEDGTTERVLPPDLTATQQAEAVAAFFADARAPVPERVTNYQARQALIAAGLFVRADAAVKASGDLSAQQAWDYANEFYRDSPFIATLGAVLELSGEAIDALFRDAERVQ